MISVYMSNSFKAKVLSSIKNVDSHIQNFVDKTFPQNLTLRYIIGLAIIGLLSICGHILIQYSLVKLESDEKIIRLIDNQSDDSERFYREVLHIQTISRESDFYRQIEVLKKDSAEVVNQHREIIERINTTYWFLNRLPQDIVQLNYQLIEAFERLDDAFGRLSDVHYFSDPQMYVDDRLILSFLRREERYRQVLDKLTKRYEQNTSQAIVYFNRLEITFLFMTILVLLLEGLYIFRPAVRRVYASLRLRTDFLSKMSHEIRNPMNSIIGMTQLLGKTKLNQQQKSYVRILENSGLGLLEMLNDLLDFSELESGKLKIRNTQADLYAIVEKAIDLVTIRIQEKDLEFILDVNADVPLVVETDPIRVQQVLVNLLSNAAKFTEKGYIKLSVQKRELNHLSYIQFSVTDTGVGIETSKIESIFESFVQENSSVKRKYGGTGLGLTIAREIASRLKGKIEVQTQKGAGSTFRFLIPSTLSDQPKTLLDYVPIRLERAKYLLVDQHEEARNSLKKLIETQPIECTALGEPEHFQEVIQLIKVKDFEKIILDAKTFGPKLEDFLIYLRQAHIDLRKVCILFSYIHANYLFSLLNNYGVRFFFQKPVKPIEFLNYLSGHLQDSEWDQKENKEYVLTSTQRYKILVAEDSADNRLLLKLFLEKFPVDTYFAENGKIAVELFKQQKFDVIFMDIQMPEMDGITAAQIIRNTEKEENLQTIPVLAFTAHKPEEIFIDGRNDLFTDFVLKPITIDKLRQKLTQYLKFEEVELAVTPKKDPMDVTDLIPAYLERRSQEIIQMNDLLEKNDYRMLKRIGHQLKGSAKSYGFEDLGNLGSELEKASEEGKFDLVRSVVDKISQKVIEYKRSPIN